MLDPRELGSLDDDKLALAISLLSSKIGKEILQALNQSTNNEAWSVLIGLIQDESFCVDVGSLHELLTEDTERELSRQHFGYVHRQEFREAYREDGKPIPPEFEGPKGEGEDD